MWRRLQQVAYYLRPALADADVAWAHACLNGRQRTLFDTMAIPDRAHAIRVARRLAQQQAPAWVLEAALLHDCGKPAGYGLLGRSLGVLLSPWLGNLPDAPPLEGLKRQLQIYQWHDAYGLAAATAAETSPEAQALLEVYLTPASQIAAPEDWLTALAAADDRG